MRILLDECVDQRLRHSFAEHDCQTAGYAKLAGLKNGKLLAAAEAIGFEVLITTDKGIEYEQNFTGRKIAVIILRSARNRRMDLELLVAATKKALESISPGEVVRIS